jgi:Domain of unknown function (DUF4157)
MFAPQVSKPQPKRASPPPRRSAAALASRTALAAPRVAGRDFSGVPVFARERSGLTAQPKLSIGAIDDPLEHEADRVADQVTRKAGAADPLAGPQVTGSPSQISRTCAACEEEEGAQTLQAKSAGGPSATPKGVGAALASPGRPLDPSARALLEPRFGHDFSQVRVHTDATAANSARSMNALAYTVGRDVVFGAGQYAPGTRAGQRLLAHELTHVLQQRAGLAVQRQAVKAASTDDQREFVQETIHFLEQSAERFQLAKVDDATFDRVINSWYSMVVRQEEIIDKDLAHDAHLKADLHKAYIAALRVLVAKHATPAHGEAELYRVNSGRIPLWAQPHPSHLQPGISTPIPDDTPVTGPKAGTGSFQFSRNGFDVVISPDTRVAAQAEGTGATHFTTDFGDIHWVSNGPAGNLKVTSFTGPRKPPRLTIFTSYLVGADISGPSAYGRGTTAEDKAGAKVTPESGSLRFHEGRHGQAVLDVLQANPAPVFRGKVGDSDVDFKAAAKQWKREVDAYRSNLGEVQKTQVHCVGVTIDQFHAHGTPAQQNLPNECP